MTASVAPCSTCHLSHKLLGQFLEEWWLSIFGILLCGKIFWSKFLIFNLNSFRTNIAKHLTFNFIEITLRHGCSSVNLLHIFRTALHKISFFKSFVNFEFLIHLLFFKISKWQIAKQLLWLNRLSLSNNKN